MKRILQIQINFFDHYFQLYFVYYAQLPYHLLPVFGHSRTLVSWIDQKYCWNNQDKVLVYWIWIWFLILLLYFWKFRRKKPFSISSACYRKKHSEQCKIISWAIWWPRAWLGSRSRWSSSHHFRWWGCYTMPAPITMFWYDLQSLLRSTSQNTWYMWWSELFHMSWNFASGLFALHMHNESKTKMNLIYSGRGQLVKCCS